MTNETRPLITEDNIETGQVIVRPMTDQEYENWLKITHETETE